MKNFELITTNCALDTIKNAQLRSECANFEKFAKAADIALGGVAFTARKIQLLFNGIDAKHGDTIDGFKNYADFMEKHYGVKRAQAFNLAKAGSMLEPCKGKLQFIDRFSKAANSEECFSNTAIIRIAEFINRDKHATDNEKDVIALIENGVLKQTMSIAQLTKKLEEFAGGKIDLNGNALIETTATEKDNDSDNSDKSDNSGESGTPKTHDDRQNEKTVSINLPLHVAQTLKAEMCRFTEMEEYGKEGLPAMWAFIEMLSEQM